MSPGGSELSLHPGKLCSSLALLPTQASGFLTGGGWHPCLSGSYAALLSREKLEKTTVKGEVIFYLSDPVHFSLKDRAERVIFLSDVFIFLSIKILLAGWMRRV